MEQPASDDYIDNEDNIIVADHYSASYFNDQNDEMLRQHERDPE